MQRICHPWSRRVVQGRRVENIACSSRTSYWWKETREHRGQQRSPSTIAASTDLAVPDAALRQRAGDAEAEQHAAAPKSPTSERRTGASPFAEGAAPGEGDVIDVVAGLMEAASGPAGKSETTRLVFQGVLLTLASGSATRRPRIN